MPDLRYRDPDYAAKYRAGHREQINARARGYLKDPDKRDANRRRASAHYYAHQEERQARQRAYYDANKDRLAETTLARKYGLSLDAYRELVARHGGACGICGTVALLSVDHDHATGAVRGLLCGACNFMVGQAKDDPATLRAAATYLEAQRAG